VSIRVQGLKKSFDEKVVLDGFDLEVPEGEIVSVIGGSGSGKSTALKSIIRLVEPDAGEIWVDERNVRELEIDELYDVRRKVGYVFQFAALFDSMSLGENVAMGLRRIPGLSRDEIAGRVAEALRVVGLEGLEDRMPAELSGGMQKRAGVARAVALEPKYLLYDEPTTGLDPVTVSVIDRLILRMRDELGVTSLVITHDMESAYRISDEIAMLHEGRVQAVGTPDEIRETSDPIVRGFIEGKPELLEEVS
jgi:phospholipid/cholesterol/gamma-HCH transport system ATP-binding protein